MSEQQPLRLCALAREFYNIIKKIVWNFERNNIVIDMNVKKKIMFSGAAASFS